MEIDKQSFFWKYLSDGQKGLIEEGFYLLNDANNHKQNSISDFSYLVFPFAKAYEGFLKKLFLDLSLISKESYESDRFRIGKALNPSLEKHLRHESVYDKIVNLKNRELAEKLWINWKKGRNLVFHYFPHNTNALKFEEANTIIKDLLDVMQEAVNLFDNKKL
jgi:hypothetical protein